MKKVISMLLFVAAAAFATSCDAVEDSIDDLIGSNEEIEYTGTMIVSAGGYTTYTNEAAEFVLETNDNEVSILMKEMKFAEAMPVTLDIQISDIATDGSAFSTTEIIPTVSSIPMEDYTMTNVAGEYSKSSLTMSFDCYDCTVTFVGAAQ